ncbi:hypothetical protein BZARG_2798 [Bizionia argentinensis JUB59]|uniref:Pyrrolo-quinoline quinone repeat domain-containing protein n=1 Tax=Bizionia argentinensis JUB59 TaxID=1046627 RepID=G2EFI6_9FLAO|nr:PQQ-binding-like beta-propeller repeat protein [Bizionia argentinensis]EGV42813.1 hypothetical protein BZARG_2798 [Bizionia argentinensis JUB59]
MNFKEVKKIENTYKCFKIEEQLLVSKQTGEVFFYALESLKFLRKIDFNRSFYSFFSYNNNFYFQDSSSGEMYRKEDNRFDIYMKGSLKKYNNYGVDNEKILIYKDKLGTEIEQGVYSLKTQEVLWWSKTNTPLRLNDDFLYGVAANKVISLNINNGEILWETSFQEEYKDLRTNLFYVVYNKTCVLSLGDEILIGLHTDTGEILWQIDACNNTNYVLDEKNGKLKGVTSIGYFEVDIATGGYKRTLFEPMEKLFNDPTIFDSQRDNFVLENNHIITTDYRRGIIGAFNIKTLQYDWFHEEKGVYFPSPRPIKYFQPYLFVTDNKDTLHIFKNDDQNLTNV